MAFDVQQYTAVVQAAKDLKRASRMVAEWQAKEQEAQKRLEDLTSTPADTAVNPDAVEQEQPNVEQEPGV